MRNLILAMGVGITGAALALGIGGLPAHADNPIGPECVTYVVNLAPPPALLPVGCIPQGPAVGQGLDFNGAATGTAVSPYPVAASSSSGPSWPNYSGSATGR